MAHTISPTPVFRASFTTVARVLKTLADFADAVALANGRFRRMQALTALSDAELAERGMKREDIVRVIFDAR